jgi:hypothetical protein
MPSVLAVMPTAEMQTSASSVSAFHYGNFRTQSAVEAGEFQTDGARADDHEGLGQLLRRQRLAIGPDLVAVGLETDLRQGPRPRAHRQHDRLRLDGAVAACLQGHDHLRGPCPLLQLRRSLDDLDLVLLHQEGDALVHLGRDAARPLDDGVEVKRGAGRRQAVVLQVRQALVFLAGLQQRLGGDAAPVQADAAQILTLDDGRLQTQLAGADGGDIAARAGADHDEVEFGHEPDS